MVKITFLGACQEVGRSGVLIESEETGDCILCDYGTKMDEDEQLFPEHVAGKRLTAIVASHAHIDHVGGLPLFYISGSVPLYLTKLTFKVTEILLMDMLKISTSYLPFEKREIRKMARYANFLNYRERRKVGKNAYITLYNAGHIPGSAVVLVEMDGQRILYTGDINAVETQLLAPLDVSDIPQIDVVITETTYGNTDHSPRKELEDSFVEKVSEVVKNGGIALIPAFGVSRSQEILMVLTKNGPVGYPLTVDGMARTIAYLYEQYPAMLRDSEALKKAINYAHFITQRHRDRERAIALQHPGAIVAPSGMLKGGTSRMYTESLRDNPKNAIFLVSYQIEETPGRVLLDEHIFIDNDPKDGVPVSAQVFHFDFSSHSGKKQLIEMLENLKFRGQKQVFCVHGEKEVMEEFASLIKDRGFNVETPVPGQSFKI